MLKQTITFEDFNGNERELDLYFNLTEAELVDMQADSEEGIQKDMMDAVAAKDMRRLLDFVKMLVHRAYGERDKDGIHFHKSPEITAAFVNSAMYSPLLLSLFQDEGARTEAFITGLMPADLVQKAIDQSQGLGNQPAPQTGPGSSFRRPQDHLPKQESESTPKLNEAPAIGRPSSPAVATVPEEFQPAQRTKFVPVVEEPEQPQPFRVKEEPIADPTPEVAEPDWVKNLSPADYEAYKAYEKSQQGIQ